MGRFGLTLIDDSLHEAIASCEDCVTACEYCLNACLDEEGTKQCTRAARDCADLCSLAIRFMARHAALTPELCDVVVKGCTACAEECGRHDLEACRACITACERCATHCTVIAA